MKTAFNFTEIDEILSNYPLEERSVISILQDVQKIYRFLPKEALIYIAQSIGISDAKIYSVATFYENFSLVPKGEYVVKICDGTACHVRKSIPILEAIRKELNLSYKEHTTKDMLFTVETVSCLGACGLAPVITINDKVYPSLTPEMGIRLVQEILKEAK